MKWIILIFCQIFKIFTLQIEKRALASDKHKQIRKLEYFRVIFKYDAFTWISCLHFFCRFHKISTFITPIQGYPQRMRLQRRLYGTYTVCGPNLMNLRRGLNLSFFPFFLLLTVPDSNNFEKKNKKLSKPEYFGTLLNWYSFWYTLFCFKFTISKQ